MIIVIGTYVNDLFFELTWTFTSKLFHILTYAKSDIILIVTISVSTIYTKKPTLFYHYRFLVLN